MAGSNLYTRIKKIFYHYSNNIFSKRDSRENAAPLSPGPLSGFPNDLGHAASLSGEFPGPGLLIQRQRNKSVAQINALPIEILTPIFELVVHDTKHSASPWVTNGHNIFQRATTLASVCSLWRRIALDVRSLWSRIILLDKDCGDSDDPKVRLWLQHAGGAPLDVVVMRQSTEHLALLPILNTYAKQFRTIYLYERTQENIQAMMSCWLEHGTSGSVAELSISTPRVCFLLAPESYALLHTLNRSLRVLRMLRLDNVYVHWGSVTFEALVDLRLGFTVAEARMEIADLARILTVSPKLTNLTLSLIEFNGEGLLDVPPINAPSLRMLFLEMLNAKDLACVLALIAPGSYDVHLCERFLPGLFVPKDSTSVHSLLPQLRRVSLITLNEGFEEDQGPLRSVLQQLPNLHTIILDKRWMLNEETLQAMTPPSEHEQLASGITFPMLRAMHIIDGCILDRQDFKKMVASHCIEQLTIRARMCCSEDRRTATQLDPTDELCAWLSDHVADFLHVGRSGSCEAWQRLAPHNW